MMKKLLFLSLVGAVVALGTPSLASAASTLYVNDDAVANPLTGKDCKKPNYNTVQAAVNAASAGDKMVVCKGTYIEQVTIDKSLILKGEGVDKSVIKAPAVLVPEPLDGKKNVVQIDSGATVDASELTVSGPGPSPCGSIDSGIAVLGGATLNLDHAAVQDIRDDPAGGCQNGEGIRAGTQRFSANAQVGHIAVSHSFIVGYQKNGIVVAGAGSTGNLEHNTVSTTPSPFIGSNGIQVTDGATASAHHNSVSGNQCNLSPPCGPDPVNDVQATGFLIFNNAGAGTTISNNDVFDNDIGIYTDIGAKIDHNDASGNRFEGIYVDGSPTGGVVSHNKIKNDGDGNYGIFVAPTFTGSATFEHNDAKGNAIYDLYWAGNGVVTFEHNKCGTAFPSKAAWDCD